VIRCGAGAALNGTRRRSPPGKRILTVHFDTFFRTKGKTQKAKFDSRSIGQKLVLGTALCSEADLGL
jgi:hypothetical protein